MKSKSCLIFLLALLMFCCEKMEITRSDRSTPNTDGAMERSARPPACVLPDAAVSSFTIDYLVGNILYYHFTVTNFGAGYLPLSAMYFQAYLSSDDLLDPADVPAGGSIFTTAPILASGGSFSQGWSYDTSPSVNLTDYHFLIIQLLSVDGVVPEECSTGNNVSINDLGCNLADAQLERLTFDYVDLRTNQFYYHFTVYNFGWAPLNLNQMIFQAYLSSDAVLDSTDIGAGGAIFFGTDLTLAKNDSHVQGFSFAPTIPIDLSTYHYMIIQAYVWDGTIPECRLDNNITVAQFSY